MRHKSGTKPRAWIVCLTFGLSFHAANAADVNDAKKCSLSAAAKLDLRTMPDGRISIPVKVQGRNLFFLIDTGGVVSTIDPGVVVAEKLVSHKTATRLAGVGTVLDHYVEATDFSIGRLSAKGFLFYVQPTSWRGVAGTIAPEILRAYDVDIDFAGGKFNLVSPDHCPGQVIYWTNTTSVAVVPMETDRQSGHIRIPVKVDGKEIEATVDTGSDASILSLRAAKRYLDFDEKAPGVKALGSGTNQSYVYPFKTMNFEGITVSNPYIVILPDIAMRNLGSDIILGTGILRQLHMFIAYSEDKLYLTPATAH
jgi:predicted aspartyl protease